MMNAYSLPTSIEIGGVEYGIRSDYRAILDIMISQNDPELDQNAKTYIFLSIFYTDWQKIPPDRLEEAVKKESEFIDCGCRDDGRPKPRLIDWEQDAGLIIPAVNAVAHTEVRAVPYMHWWTFFAYYMEIGESLFSNVVNIRSKRARGKKLEKYEQEFYRENKGIIDLKQESAESRMEAEMFEKWLAGEEV